MHNVLNYNNAYTGDIGEWYTEFVDGNLTVASPTEQFIDIIADSKIAYAHRSRDPQSEYYGTWQTTHTSVYDIENRELYICVQEDYKHQLTYKLK